MTRIIYVIVFTLISMTGWAKPNDVYDCFLVSEKLVQPFDDHIIERRKKEDKFFTFEWVSSYPGFEEELNPKHDLIILLDREALYFQKEKKPKGPSLVYHEIYSALGNDSFSSFGYSGSSSPIIFQDGLWTQTMIYHNGVGIIFAECTKIPKDDFWWE